MDRFFWWYNRQDRNPTIFLWVSISMFLLGSVFSFVIPPLARKSAINNAELAISNANVEMSLASQTRDSQKLWFNPSYLEGLQKDLNLVEELVQEAEIALSQANSGSVSASIKLAKLASNKASEATTLVNAVQAILTENASLRTTAMQDQKLVTELLVSTQSDLEVIQHRFDDEEINYLNKYTDPMGNDLDDSDDKTQKAQAELNTAIGLLPNLDSIDRSGDPKTAQDGLDKAKIIIDEINTLVREVTAGLDYQAEAKTNAQPKTDQAREEYTGSASYVSQVKSNTRYWLNVPSATLVAAEADVNLAEVTLIIDEDERLIDYPVAYKAALSSLNLSAQAIREADDEVATATRANQKIAEIITAIERVENRLPQAQSAEDNLDYYHAYEAWRDVSGNISSVRNKVSSARNYLSTAQSYVSIQTQRFAEAKAMANSGLSELTTANNLIQEVIDRNTYLERKLAEWPGAERDAQFEIDSNQSRINHYGGYSSSARSNFNSAVTTLDAAISDADRELYESAVTKANEAESLASGTGAKAERAYDDEIERQERARREAEEAAQRAAEAAAQQAANEAARQLSESSSSSSDSSSCCDSSSSSSGSSYSSSDGGDWSNSSSSGDGGDW